MAKSTKKTSNSLKSNNVTGRKKILLITIAALVVIGAGAVIRSFAATGDQIFNLANNNLYSKNGATVVADAAKNNANVIRIPKGGSAVTPAILVPGNICVMVRADSNIANGTGAFVSVAIVGLKGGGDGPIGVTTNWTEVCPGLGNNGRAITVEVKNTSNVPMYLSYVKNQAAVVTPVVTPTCSKNCSK